MRFNTAAILGLFTYPLYVSAQGIYGPAPGPQGGTSSSTAAAAAAPSPTAGQHIIMVAQNGLAFTPSNITANVGETVTFFWANGPHTVTQTSFANPCSLLGAGTSTVGFDSGMQNPGQQWTLTITNASQPIWFYCKVPTHCPTGMVGSINAPLTGNTFDAYLNNAKSVNPEPDQTVSGGLVGVGASASASPSAASSTTGSAAARFGAGAGVLFAAGAAILGAVSIF